MGIRAWLTELWNGQIRGSGAAAGLYLALLAGAWAWAKVIGLDRPDTLTGFLVWIYALLAVVVTAALLAGSAVRIIFLRLNHNKSSD